VIGSGANKTSPAASEPANPAQTSAGSAGSATSDADSAQTTDASSGKAGASGHRIDYFITNDKGLTFSLDGNVATFSVTPEGDLAVVDSKGKDISLAQNASSGEITLEDERFKSAYFTPARDEEEGEFFVFALRGEKREWKFRIEREEQNRLIFQNDLGKTADLVNVPHFGFKNNPGFGSGRGYIWSVSLPMLKDTIFIGKGADTYCLYFPHKDYVGKYNANWGVNMIVDKPHNMYIGIAFNTGLLSLIAWLVLFGVYLVQSFRLYRRETFDTFASYAGAGIFLGICGFLVSGVVNDTTVSVMPMFYGLFGTGIAANMIVSKRRQAEREAGK
jgi:hypothetical protein